jgi:hypothetical protein
VLINPSTWLYNRLLREVNSEAEHGLETMWTRCRLFAHVDCRREIGPIAFLDPAALYGERSSKRDSSQGQLLHWAIMRRLLLSGAYPGPGQVDFWFFFARIAGELAGRDN